MRVCKNRHVPDNECIRKNKKIAADADFTSTLKILKKSVRI